MKLAVFGYGGVGKALIRLIEDKKEVLKLEGLDLSVQCSYLKSHYADNRFQVSSAPVPKDSRLT